jgi:hypothetical protein
LRVALLARFPGQCGPWQGAKMAASSSRRAGRGGPENSHRQAGGL